MQSVPQNNPGLRGWVTLLAVVLGVLAGLCALFALVVTAAQGWQERTWAQWPKVTAQVQQCRLAVYMTKPRAYRIDCSLGYLVRGEEIASHVHSRSTPAPRRVIGPEPGAQFGQMQNWVDEHPPGTSILIHYDPANPAKAVLVETDMPIGGRQTPDNLKLLGFFGVSCAVLLTIARMAWPRPAQART